jgi:hypothetical protein
MILPNAYRQLLGISEDRVLRVTRDSPLSIESVTHGVIFFMARWSGKSQLSFRSLNGILRRSSCDRLKLYVADVDEEYVQNLMVAIGLESRGAGETAWIRNGCVIGTLSSYTDASTQTAVELTQAVCSEATE